MGKDFLLNQLKSIEAQTEYIERENHQLEQDVSGSEFLIQQLQTERKIIQEKGGNAKRMVARLESSIQLQSRMVEAIETTASHLPRLDDVLDSDYDKILKTAEGQLDQQSKRLENANQMHSILVDRSRLQQDEFTQRTSAFLDQAKAAEKQLDEAKVCLAEANKTLKEEEVSKEDLLNQLQKVNQMIQSHCNSLEELNGEGGNLDTKIGKLEQEATEMGKEINEARAEAANLAAKSEVESAEGATLSTQVETLKVNVHGLEFTLESNKHVPGELEVAKADLARLHQSVQNVEDQFSTLKDAPLQKMVNMEVHDKLCISSQVYDRRLAETQRKEEVVHMGDGEIIQLTESKEAATKEKENLEVGQEQLCEQVRVKEAQTAHLNDQLQSMKQALGKNQDILNEQVTSLDNFRLQFADLEVATKRKEELDAQLETITNNRLAKRGDYESTNQSFLADIKKFRDTKDCKEEAVKTLEFELNGLQNGIKEAKAAMQKTLSDAKVELSDKVGIAVEAALEQAEKDWASAAEKASAEEAAAAQAEKAAKREKAIAEKEAKKTAAAQAERDAAEKAERAAATAKKAAQEEIALAEQAAQVKTAKVQKVEKAASTKRVSFAKSVASSPCYPANPIRRTLSGSSQGGMSVSGSGPSSNPSTATPRSAKGKRLLTSAANKTVPLPSRSQRNAAQKKKNDYFGFTSSDEEENTFSGKPAPVPKTKATAAAPVLSKKPASVLRTNATAPVRTPSTPSRTLTTPARTLTTPARSLMTPARSPFRIFGSKNNTPNKAANHDDSDS